MGFWVSADAGTTSDDFHMTPQSSCWSWDVWPSHFLLPLSEIKMLGIWAYKQLTSHTNITLVWGLTLFLQHGYTRSTFAILHLLRLLFMQYIYSLIELLLLLKLVRYIILFFVIISYLFLFFKTCLLMRQTQ